MTDPAVELHADPWHEQALEAACVGAGAGAVEPMTEYQTRPLDFMVEQLGVRRETLVWSQNPGYEDHEWDGDPDPFVAALDALVDTDDSPGQDVGVESGTGTGKTFWLMALIYWFLGSFEDALVVTAAPKQDQLLKHVWKEVGRKWDTFQRSFPEAVINTGHIAMLPGAENKERWAASAFVCGVGADEEIATKAQGWHAEHMLIITEETPGIHPAIMRAFQNTRTAPHNLQVSVGNPDHRDDPLHQFCLQPSVRHVRVSALDHPNVVCDDPTLVLGAVSTKKVVERKILYANTPAMYDSRVRGISPKQAFGVALNFREADHLQGWTDEAVAEKVEAGWTVWSAVDLGDWRSSWLAGLADRAGRMHVVRELWWHKASTDEIAEGVHGALDAMGAPDGTTVVTDRRDAHSVTELNRALKKLGSPYRAVAVSPAAKARKAAVRRINDLLGRRALLFRRDLGAELDWRLGLSTSNQGDPRKGSRLFWELSRWRYPDPREGEAQREDPDDDTADGADAIAALRYLVMTWWKEAPWSLPEPGEDPDRDTALERYMEAINKAQQRADRQAKRAARRTLTRRRR